MHKFNMDNGMYSPLTVDFTDELDKVKKLVFIYSCNQKLIGGSTVIIRAKLVTLLALYIIHGYSKKTRALAASILNSKPEQINSMNLEIRNLGYLIKDKMNSRKNHLCQDLVDLKDYVDAENPEQALYLFRIGREQKSR